MVAKTSGRALRQRAGATVRTFRERQGLSLVTLAEVAGLSPSHASRIERGLTMPSYGVLARIATALGTDLTTLTAEEATTKAVDAQLDAALSRLGLSAESRADLLRLTPATRAELAAALDHR